ncbi:serine protease 30 isoform X2 [Nilaparvata lugens]|nr:serine protease 30 isoform X2 [Nilaparvata lugens]
MTGWGVYKFHPQTNRKLFPAVLQKATLKIRDENTCKQNLSKAGVRTGNSNPIESFLCAGGEDPDHHIYLGDSGGSLVILESVEADIPRYSTVGLASLSATAQNPRVTPISDFYTHVSFYLEWILDTIAENSGM